MNEIKYKRLLMLLLLLIVETTTMYGQITATVHTNFRPFPSLNDQSEVHVSINKTDYHNIILSFNSNNQQGYCYSTDNGQTWTGSDEMPNNQSSYCDPSTAFDASGRGYISTMTPLQDGFNIQYTINKGLNWSNSISDIVCNTYQGFDKEMIFTVDEMQPSPYANKFYCAYTDFDMKNNGGNNSNIKVKFISATYDGSTYSFNEPLILRWMFGHGTNVQTGPNGEVYVCWADYTNANFPGQNIGFAYSYDGGSTFTTSYNLPYLGIRVNNLGNSYFGNTRVNDFPVMAVDKSCGEHRGRVYIVYPEKENENSSRSVIKLRFLEPNLEPSDASNWSDPVLVNINDQNNLYGYQNWFPWIAIDDLSGLVNVVYYSIDQPIGSVTNTYVAYSIDGINWQNIRVSDESHTTAPISGHNYTEGYAGDYICIASFNGKSWVAWGDNRNPPGNWQIWLAEIDYNIPVLMSSEDNLDINLPTITGNRSYYAYNEIQAANNNQVTIDNNAIINFKAGNKVILLSGFSTQNDATFIADIDEIQPCSTPGSISMKRTPTSWGSEGSIIKETFDSIKIFAYPNPSNDFITVGCLNDNYENISISVQDINGNIYYNNQPPDIIDKYQIRKIFDVKDFPSGVYLISIQIDYRKYFIKFIRR